MKLFSNLKQIEPKKWDLPVNYSLLTWQECREVREQYMRQQKGLCYYCKTALNQKPDQTLSIDLGLFPPGFMDNPVHLHHHHVTDTTIGAVHAYCNAVLWQYWNE